MQTRGARWFIKFFPWRAIGSALCRPCSAGSQTSSSIARDRDVIYKLQCRSAATSLYPARGIMWTDTCAARERQRRQHLCWRTAAGRRKGREEEGKRREKGGMWGTEKIRARECVDASREGMYLGQVQCVHPHRDAVHFPFRSPSD